MAGSAGGEDEDMIAGINVTPLVDITLVLLIIFIATSSIIIKAEKGVTLPDAKTAEQSGKGLINVTVLKQGKDKALIYMQGQIVENQATLRRDLEAEKKLDKDVKVIISADQQIEYQEVSDIVDAIRKNEFREDLFHRLNVMQFRPPPLRDRSSDIAPLAQHFLRQFAACLGKSLRNISEPARAALLAHSWPGNVRELRNVIERAAILETTEIIQASSLPDFEVESRLRENNVRSGTPGRAGGGRPAALGDALLQFERELILGALAQHDNHLGKAAAHLDITRHALRYRMSRLNITLDTVVDDDSDATSLSSGR